MRLRRILLWLLLVASVGACFLWPRDPGRSGSFAVRLLGPVASLAASGQWVRMRHSWTSGRSDLACSQAELALELDPGATAGWAFFASHLAYDRGAPDRERDPAKRALWVKAALEVLARGELTARRPWELAMQRGTILVRVGDPREELPWPEGTRGAWSEAQAAFERAAELDPGHPEAWVQAAANRLLRLGDPVLEPEFAARRRALEEALALLERGAATAREPESLLYMRGCLLAGFARGSDGELHPLGRGELYHLAAEAFRVAKEAGHPLAEVAEESARSAQRAAD